MNDSCEKLLPHTMHVKSTRLILKKKWHAIIFLMAVLLQSQLPCALATWGQRETQSVNALVLVEDTKTDNKDVAPRPRLNRRSSLRLRDDPVLSKEDGNEFYKSGLETTESTSKHAGLDSDCRFADNKSDGEEARATAITGGIWHHLGDLAKALLPSVHRLSDRVEKIDDEMSTATAGLPDLFQNASLPFRLMGSVVTPILVKAVTGLAFEENHDLMQQVLQQAHQLLTNNDDILDLLGSPLLTSPSPFAEKSSVSKRDGKLIRQIELSFTISGSREAGVAYLVATDQGIEILRVTTVQGHHSVDILIPETSGWLVVSE